MSQSKWTRAIAGLYLRASRHLLRCMSLSFRTRAPSPCPGAIPEITDELNSLARSGNRAASFWRAKPARTAFKLGSVATFILMSQHALAVGVTVNNVSIYSPNGLAAGSSGAVSAGLRAQGIVTPAGTTLAAVKSLELREVTGTTYASRGTYNCTLVYNEGSTTPSDVACTASIATPLAPGAHELYMHAATTSILYTGDSAHVIVTVTANHAPTVSISSPANGAQFETASGSASVTVAATGSDVDNNLSSVSASIDGAAASLTGASSISSVLSLPVGHHTIAVTSLDSAGASATSTVGIDVLADAAPTASLSLPAGGSQVLTNGSTASVTIQGAGGDPDAAGSGAEFDHLSLVVDGSTVIASTTSTSINTAASLGIGSHTIVMTATDKLGRSTSASSTMTVAANRAPTVSISSPSNGARALTTTSTGPFTLTSSASDADGNLSSISASIDGGAATLSGTSSINSSINLAIGHHTISVTAQDAMGMTGTSSIGVDVVADTAPTASLQSPANGSQMLASGATATVSIQGSGADADAAGSGGEIDHLSLTVDGTLQATNPGASLSTSPSLAVGTHTLVLTATDKLGLTGSSTSTITISANRAPTVSISTPANGARTLTTGTTAIFTLTATGADPDGNLSSVSASIDGAAASATGSTGVNTTLTLAIGHHTIAVTSLDAMGLTTTSTIGVDVVADTAPTAAFTTPTNGAQVLANGTTALVSVQGSSADADTAGTGGEFDHLALTVDGTPSSTVTTPTLGASLSLSVGSHTLVLVATDKLGLATSVTNTITVVADHGPIGSLSSPTAGQLFTAYTGNSATVTIVGSMTDPDSALGDSVARTEVWVDGASAKSIAGGTVNTTVSVSTAGSHSIKLHAFDAGGLAGDSAAVGVTLNVIGPMLGSVDGVFYDVTGAPMLAGWACDNGVVASVNVAIYAGGVAGTGTQVGTVTANLASEAAVGTACGTGGSTYRWAFALDALQASYGGQSLYAYGVSAQNGGAQTLLPHSGSNAVPALGTPLPVMIAPPLLSQPDAGTLPGSLAVSDTGAAHYSLPIDAPPGSGGMTPALALTYSSDAPNGSTGVGWSLDGLGRIRRCAKTIAQDGAPGRIRFDNGDRLCLDGQRLMRVDGTAQDDASYWAANGEYRTEVESFARVTAIAGGFKVERKDGHVEYYGTQATSIQTVGLATPVPMYWPLSRVEDRSGNFLMVAYFNEGQGEYVPSQISYGGNSANGTTPDLAVRLVYEPRPDAQVRYTGGSRNDLRFRLSHVQTFTGIAADGTGGSEVRDYALTYVQSQSSNRSMLSGIQACGTSPVTSATECLPKSSFEWGQQAVWGQATVPFSLGTVSTRPSVPLGRGLRALRAQANLDGSGMPSYVIPNTVSECDFCEPIDEATYHDYLTGTLSVTPSGGGAATTYTLSFGAPFPDKIDGLQFGDFNGDGLADAVLGHGDQIVAICMNNGTTTLACQNWVAPAGVTLKFTAPVDLYNDRRMHFRQGAADVWLGTDNQWHGQAVRIVDVTPAGLPTTINVAPIQSEPISFSGQDISDFYYVYPPSGLTNEVPGMLRSCVESAVASGLQYTCQTLIASPAGDGGSQTSGDLNGDGLTDFIFGMQGSNYMVCLSTEVGVNCTDSGLPSGSGTPYIGDFVGDGSTGVLFVTNSTTTPKYCHLDGNLKLQCKSVPYPDTTGPYASDVQSVDLSRIPAWLFIDNTANVGTGMEAVKPYTLKAPASQDRLTAAVNGLGYRQEVDYARSDDSATVRRLTQVNGVDQAPAYPLVSRPLTTAVKQIRSSNGQGGWLSTNHHYEGAAMHAQGRGDVGFALTARTDAQSGVTTTQTLHQDFPFTGSPARMSALSAGNKTLVDTTFTYATNNITALAGGSATVLPYLHITASAKQDLDGTDLGTSTVTDTYGDAWGNVTERQTVTTLGANSYTGTVDTTYQNTMSPWVSGLPLTVSTTTMGADGVLSAARVTLNTYDATTGYLKTAQQAPSDATYTWTNTYDRSGNVYGLVNKVTQSWTDPYTSSTVSRLIKDVDYDAQGRFTLTSRNALGQATRTTYYAGLGAVASSTDVNGLATTYKVNAFGRVTSTLTPDSNESRRYLKQCDGTCPTNAVLASIADSFNGASRTRTPTVDYLDTRGSVVQRASWAFDGTPVVVSTRFDSAGRVYEIDQPRFATGTAYLQERHFYDDLNRLTTLTTKQPDGTEVNATTQYAGPVTTLTNAKGQVRVQTNDALGHLIRIVNKTDQGDVATQLAYDSFGNLSQTTDPNGNVQTITYDKYGRRTDLRDPNLGWVHYDIDPVGRTWRITKPNERAASTFTRFQLDALDRTTDRFQSDQQDHWIFDTAAHGVGMLAEEYTGPSTAKDYRRLVAYDSLSRVSSSTTVLDTVSYVSSFTYDPWNRVLSTSEQHGADGAKMFMRTYNPQGYLGRVSHGGAAIWSLTSVDAAGRSLTATLGNGLVQVDHHDPYTAGFDDTLVRVGAAGTQRFHEHLTFDALGNALTRAGQYNYGQGDASAYSDTIGYDKLNRLTSFQEWSNAPQTFGYDTGGNLQSKMDSTASPALAATYTYPPQGVGSVRPHAVQAITGWPGTFSYDADGNQLSSPTGLATTWNSFDMPVRVSMTSGGATRFDQFVYGATHDRAKMTSGTGSAVSKITYFAGAQEVETDGSGNVTAVKTYWPLGLGVDIDVPATATQMLWLHHDRLDSVMASTDAAGGLVERLNYDAWGNRRYLNGIGISSSISDATNNKGYTGQMMLDNVNLIHLNGRLYDPYVGRFISADPLISNPNDGQNYSRYTYVLNNPTNLTDPSGFEPREPPPVVRKPDCDQWCYANGGRTSDYYARLVAQANREEAKGVGHAIQSFFFPNITRLGEDAEPGTWGDYGMGLLKGAWNTVDGLSRLSMGPLAFFTPDYLHADISSQEVSGAATFEGVAALAPLSRFARGGTVINISRSRYPESAAHIEDAQAAGQPTTLTIDRAGAAARRREALSGTPARSGLDRDEYPPAMFREGGKGASVRHIDPSDNRGAGACIGAACRGLPNGSTVTIQTGQ